jgi:hypothetical protein
MKKALKIIAIIFGSLIVITFIALLIFIKKLPSTYQIKQAIQPRAGQNPEYAAKTERGPPQAPTAALPAKAEAKARTDEDRADEGKELSLRALHEDFMNDRQPLSNVCASLGNASESHFLRSDENANSKEFMRKILDTTKDPLIESAAPVFRYVFRLPGVKDLLNKVEESQAENAEDLAQKAGFYAQLAIAAKDIRASKAQLDQVLNKSYHMYVLSRAVAQRPELARDPATLSFCEQMEKNINLNQDYNPDQQSAELSKFLEDVKISPADVNYDAGYRSDVGFTFKDNAILMENVWVEKLFAEDVTKAKKQLNGKQSPNQPPPTSQE